MASFSKGTSFTDGVTGDVTAAKLHALVDAATPVPGFITDRTAETSIATDDLVLISDTSDSGALNKMTVANLMKAELTGTINSTAGTIATLNSTTGTITTGVIPTLTSTTLITSGTGTAASPAIVPTGDTNTGIFFPAADTVAFSEGGTERMRIDSSGNVGIGTTSIGASLDIAKSDNTGSVSDFPSLRVINTNSTQGNAASTFNYARMDVKSGNGTVFADFGTRYDSSYSGAYIGTETSHPVTLQTGGTERLRITDNGAILFAKNTTDLGTVGYRYDTTGESYYSLSATVNTTVTNAIYSTGASAYRFYVGLGGTVYATNTTISAISDIRLKENIRDINVGLDSIMALKPRLFDWKSGKGQDTKNVRGFIAQEIEEVFPDLVDEWKDPAPEGEEPYKSVRQDLIPVLVKAIQEQQAMIVELQ